MITRPTTFLRQRQHHPLPPGLNRENHAGEFSLPHLPPCPNERIPYAPHRTDRLPPPITMMNYCFPRPPTPVSASLPGRFYFSTFCTSVLLSPPSFSSFVNFVPESFSLEYCFGSIGQHKTGLGWLSVCSPGINRLSCMSRTSQPRFPSRFSFHYSDAQATPF